MKIEVVEVRNPPKISPVFRTRVRRQLAKNNRRPQIRSEIIKQFSKILGKAAPYGNCWGTTLFSVGAIPNLKYVEDDIMFEWLQENTIQVVQPSFGCVLAIFNEFDGLEHTALYVGHGLWWHQEGFSGPLLVQTLAQISETYPGKQEFRELTKTFL